MSNLLNNLLKTLKSSIEKDNLKTEEKNRNSNQVPEVKQEDERAQASNFLIGCFRLKKKMFNLIKTVRGSFFS